MVSRKDMHTAAVIKEEEFACLLTQQINDGLRRIDVSWKDIQDNRVMDNTELQVIHKLVLNVRDILDVL